MTRFIRIGVTVLVVGCLVVAGILYWMGTRDDAPRSSSGALVATGEDASQRIERGRYLARVGNCMGCHTVSGGQPYAGGTPIPTRFGTLYGPNITPDVQAGIGSWDSDDFWRALHNGKSKDGSLLYPAFPYTEYTRISRADADALYAFLRTVEPSSQPSRAHTLDFPYDQRWLLAFWRAWYFEPGELPADPSQSDQWNRGRYLVTGLGHCVACHAPRNRLGATVGETLSGGMIEGLGWYAPSLMNEPVHGVGDWTAEDIAMLLRTGVAPLSTASGPMAEVVLGSTQYLSAPDAQAIGVYLKSQPASPQARQAEPVARPSSAVMDLGARLYSQHCAQCHQDQGQGSGLAWPALAGNPSVTAPSAVNAIRMVLDGGYAPATAANPRPHGMPPFGPLLADNDIAALVSFIRFSWGNQASAVSAFDVKRVRDAVWP